MYMINIASENNKTGLIRYISKIDDFETMFDSLKYYIDLLKPQELFKKYWVQSDNKWSQFNLRWAGNKNGNGMQWPRPGTISVVGLVEKGDIIVASNTPGVGIVNNNPDKFTDFVVGISDEDKNISDIKEIRILIGGGQKLSEQDFVDWLPNTEILQELFKKLNLNNTGRVRLLSLPPKSCYSYHIDGDNEWRLHIPLITNNDSFIIIDGETWHMPIGHSYIINTSVKHTAVNCGNTTRIHLVVSNVNLPQ